jgi:hypothetical protein
MFVGLLLCGCAAKPARQTSPTGATMLQAGEIDIHVRGFADSFMSRVGFQYNQIIINAKTPQQRTWALQARLGQGIATLSDSTEPNPTVNLLNMVVLVTLKRMSIQDYWIPNLLHENGNDLLTAYQESEKDAWELAARVFTDQQITDLHNLIDKWKKDNPDQYYTGFIKFTDFIDSAPANSNHGQAPPSNLFRLLYVDPFAGLDPVAQEARNIRIVSERVVYVALRMPELMNWQLEEASDRIMSSPDVQRVITSSERYATVGDRFNEIVASYPNEYSKATAGAINQINAAATEQRLAIEKQLNSESDQVHGVLSDARNSILVARDAATSINQSTSQTVSAAENVGQRIIDRAIFGAIVVIIIGFLWPAMVFYTYRYATRRWLER